MTDTIYTAGDLVEAVKGETVTRGRLHLNGKYLWVGDSGRTPENLESYGFTLRIVEKAAAVVVLPSELGIYEDHEGDLWQLNVNGWKLLTSDPPDAFKPENYVPFTLLAPVSETAKKVLDRVFGMTLGGASVLAATERLRAGFGVTE